MPICRIAILVFALTSAANAGDGFRMPGRAGPGWTSAMGEARDAPLDLRRGRIFDPGGTQLAADSSPRDDGTLVVDPPWARATPGRARTGAAYFTVINRGRSADRLLSVSSPIARRADIHRNINDNGIMRMRKVDGIDIPPGRSATLKPGGYHVMLMGLSRPLVEGQEFKLKLNFKKSGARTVTVKVLGMGATGGGHGHDGTGDHMGHK